MTSKSDLKTLLPRGIHIVERPHVGGTKRRFFRVQMKRKELEVDQLFDNITDALEFLNLQLLKLGKEPVGFKNISDLTVKQIQKKTENPTFEQYVLTYIKEYVNPKYQAYDDIVDCYNYDVEVAKKTLGKRAYYKERKVITDKYPTLAEAKAKVRNRTNIKSFFDTICFTEVSYGSLGSLGIFVQEKYERGGKKKPLASSSPVNFGLFKKDFGKFTIDEITPRIINAYIKERVKAGLRAESIKREITFISNVFNKIHKMNEDVIDPVPNPTKDYDRELLEVAKQPKDNMFRFTDELKEQFLREIEKHENPDFAKIIKLMLLTAMRRSEVILLKWEQLHLDENYIQLTDTKNKARKVYLLDEAVKILRSVEKKDGHPRVFSSYISVNGFEGSYTKFIKEKKFFDENGEELVFKHITTHKFRKEAISTLLEEVGNRSSLLLAKIVGAKSVKGIERHIRDVENMPSLSTQDDILKSVGHSDSEVTFNHYFSLKPSK